MGDTYPPILSLDEEDQPSNFLNLFNRFSSQYPDIGQFLQPDDPDLKKYQELSLAPTGSEDLIKNYMGRMPTHETFEPDLKTKLIATFLGSMAGNPLAAAKTARGYVDEPYADAVEEWKNEGAKVNTEVRLMDAGRTRELQAIKYGLQTKANAGKSRAQQDFREQQEARRIAAEVAREEERKKKLEEDQQQRDFMNELRTSNRNITKTSQENLEAQRAFTNSMALQEQQRRNEAAADKAADLDKVNKRLAAYASRLGIDTSKLTALDVANRVALKRAEGYSFFKPVMPEEGSFDIRDDVDKARADLLRKWLQSQRDKLFRGEFE